MKRIFLFLALTLLLGKTEAQTSEAKENIKQFFNLLYKSQTKEINLVNQYFYTESDSAKIFWSSILRDYRNLVIENQITDYKKLKANVIAGKIEILAYHDFSEEDKSQFKHISQEYQKNIYEIKGESGHQQYVFFENNKIKSLLWAGEAKGFFISF